MESFMNITSWLEENTTSLKGKTVAITGSTGGLGKELCKHIASLGANLILIDRNRDKSENNMKALHAEFPGVSGTCISANLESIESVKRAVEGLKKHHIDIFIHNAGAYSIPRSKCSTGYDNVFQINFVSPYYMIKELMPQIKKNKGRVVVVGSIAHGLSRADIDDVDFSSVNSDMKVYGNAKRYLMLSLHELFKEEKGISLSIVHPGITPTNITSGYPKIISKIIKYPMKLIFTAPEKASLSAVRGMFEKTEYHTWIGPRVFGIWGFPVKSELKSCSIEESEYISDIAEKIYEKCKAMK
jgi:NAD(P)-dependent dehydrogenase (short-subunit alcohol dehydrogenase family)